MVTYWIPHQLNIINLYNSITFFTLTSPLGDDIIKQLSCSNANDVQTLTDQRLNWDFLLLVKLQSYYTYFTSVFHVFCSTVCHRMCFDCVRMFVNCFFGNKKCSIENIKCHLYRLARFFFPHSTVAGFR